MTATPGKHSAAVANINHYLESVMHTYSEYEATQALMGLYDPFEPPFLSTDESSSFTVICEKVSQVFSRCFNEISYARTVAELSKLSDAQLRDIGLSYGEIELAARQAVENS
jgi:uncharacterized protein YjiS (DUF1127 family)